MSADEPTTDLHHALRKVGKGELDLEDALRQSRSFKCQDCGDAIQSPRETCSKCGGEMKIIPFTERGGSQ